MARQGNYVTVPGGGVDWTSDISSSLMDLAKSYLAQGEAEKDRERLAARDAENKRRWDLQESRRAQAEEERLKGIANEKAAKNILWELASDPSKQSYELSDYSPEMQKTFSRLTDRVKNERNAVEKFLLTDSEDIQPAAAVYRDNLLTSNLNEAEVDKLAAQNEIDLRSLKDELTFGDYTPEQVNKKINDFLDTRYNSRLTEIEDKIRSGAGLTQGEQVNALLDQIPANLREYLDVGTTKEALKGIVTGPTRASLEASEEARVAATNETMLKNIDLYDKYIGRMSAGSSSGKYQSNVKGMADALKDMGKVDIGWWDTADAKKGFKRLISLGIDPELASASIAFGIDKGWIGDRFPSIDSPEFANIQEQAQLLQKSKRIDSNNKSYISREAYTYAPEQARSFSEIQRRLIGFNPIDKRGIPVSEEFDLRQGRPITKFYPSLEGTWRPNTPLDPNNLLPSPEELRSSANTPDIPVITKDEALSTETTDILKNSPAFERLSAAVGGNIPSTTPKVVLSSRGNPRLPSVPVPLRPSTPAEKIRDEILSLMQLRDETLASFEKSNNFLYDTSKSRSQVNKRLNNIDRSILELGRQLNPDFSLEDLISRKIIPSNISTPKEVLDR